MHSKVMPNLSPSSGTLMRDPYVNVGVRGRLDAGCHSFLRYALSTRNS